VCVCARARVCVGGWVVPDIALICENMLMSICMSEGFLSARRVAKKFVTLYGLSKELLSKQMHYDWGLRVTKAVLRVAGDLKPRGFLCALCAISIISMRISPFSGSLVTICFLAWGQLPVSLI
jgi:hypothetical protein